MSLDKEKLSDAVKYLEGIDVQKLAGGQASAGNASKANDTAEPNAGQPSSLERPITPPKARRSMGPFVVNLKGLVSMHSPDKTSILYSAPEDETGRLYPFCLAVQNLFKDGEFLVEDDRELKLHATIVNTIYAKGRKRRVRFHETLLNGPQCAQPSNEASLNAEDAESTVKAESGAGEDNDRSQGHGASANAPLKINATAILRRYKDFVWAEGVKLDRIAICEMGAKKIADANGNVVGEEYTEVASIPLPN